MAKIITEDDIEQAAIAALHKRHNYGVLRCYTKAPETLPDNTGRANKRQTVLPEVLLERLKAINPAIPEDTLRSVADEISRPSLSGDLMLTNFGNYQKIRDGVTVQYKENGRITSNRLRLIDFETPSNNSFIVASQMWIRGDMHWRRFSLS